MTTITISEILSQYDLTTDGLTILSNLESKHPLKLTSEQVNDFVDFVEYMNYSKRNENKVRRVEPSKRVITYNSNGQCSVYLY